MGESGSRSGIKAETRFRVLKLVYLNSMLILCFFLFELNAAAPRAITTVIFVSEPVEAYTRLINAVVMVESSGDTLAFNLLEEAYGAFQIRPIRLLDYYQRTGKNYKMEDCFNYQISKEIFLYYAVMNGSLDYQSIARNWNGSGKMTLDYWKKVLVHLQ
jgi:hypothetical protein